MIIETAAGATGSGNDMVWVVLTVGLTMLFLMKPVVAFLIKNPLGVPILIVLIIVVYIIIKAIFIVIGVGDAIDGYVTSTAATLSTIGR
jgi:hypothetical protein